MLSETDRALQDEGFAAIAALIDGASSVAICAHTSPDGDALGSELALAEVIRTKWPQAEVATLLADDEEVPRILRFLPGAEGLVSPEAYDGTPDLFIAVDLSEITRLNLAEQICRRAVDRAILDHHPCAEPFAEARVIRPGAAAAGVIICEFAHYLGVETTPSMAQNLMAAIITDTGRFQYQNTDSEAFACAGHLVGAGADPAEISLNVYQSYRLQSLHLKSLVMGRICTFEQGRIAYSYATQNDLERTGADLSECEGLIDVVRSVDGSQVALFLKSLPGHRVRGNLRAKVSHDVSAVARRMGGGGHKSAAGFTMDGDIDEVLAQVLPLLRELVRGEDGNHNRPRLFGEQ